MLVLIELLFVFLMAIFIHELTHYCYALWSGDLIKVNFEDGSPTVHFDDRMTYLNQLLMYGLAILNGFILILLFFIFSLNYQFHLITMIVYFFGCRYDFCQLYRLMSIKQPQSDYHQHKLDPLKHDISNNK
jgi:hypothetical protein